MTVSPEVVEALRVRYRALPEGERRALAEFAAENKRLLDANGGKYDFTECPLKYHHDANAERCPECFMYRKVPGDVHCRATGRTERLLLTMEIIGYGWCQETLLMETTHAPSGT